LLDPFHCHHVSRAVGSKNSKKKKSKSSKKGPKASRSKKSKNSKGYVNPIKGDSPPPIEPSPTAAPTCLECDDYPLLQKESALARGSMMKSRTDSARRVVFAGTLLVLLISFWIVLLLHNSSREHQQEIQKKSIVNDAECFSDKPDEDTVIDDDWIGDRVFL
jgi:hypothetical protein